MKKKIRVFTIRLAENVFADLMDFMTSLPFRDVSKWIDVFQKSFTSEEVEIDEAGKPIEAPVAPPASGNEPAPAPKDTSENQG